MLLKLAPGELLILLWDTMFRAGRAGVFLSASKAGLKVIQTSPKGVTNPSSGHHVDSYVGRGLLGEFTIT